MRYMFTGRGVSVARVLVISILGTSGLFTVVFLGAIAVRAMGRAIASPETGQRAPARMAPAAYGAAEPGPTWQPLPRRVPVEEIIEAPPGQWSTPWDWRGSGWVWWCYPLDGKVLIQASGRTVLDRAGKPREFATAMEVGTAIQSGLIDQYVGRLRFQSANGQSVRVKMVQKPDEQR